MNHIVLNVNNVHHSFGETKVLHDVNLQILQGQFVALVGPSGCGKTTLLKAILGTNPPTGGDIKVDGWPVHGPTKEIGIVYQQYGLYPFLTVEKSVALGPILSETTLFRRLFMPWSWIPRKKKYLQDARELLASLRLAKSLGCYPSELSGGMRQRVAIAQSLIMKPKILLLDEPFGALDASNRESLQRMLLRLYAENITAKKNKLEPPWTVIMVTHELRESIYVSDRVIGLSRNWNNSVAKESGDHLGATIVWDKCVPVFSPDEAVDFSLFHELETNLKKIVLDDKIAPIEYNQHVTYWTDLTNGIGTGVATM